MNDNILGSLLIVLLANPIYIVPILIAWWMLVLLHRVGPRSRLGGGWLAQRCPHCRQLISQRARACAWCGHDVPKDEPRVEPNVEPKLMDKLRWGYSRWDLLIFVVVVVVVLYLLGKATGIF